MKGIKKSSGNEYYYDFGRIYVPPNDEIEI
jgi:hypothetical protein